MSGCMLNYDRWRARAVDDPDLREDLRRLAGLPEDALADEFCREMEFGTGGLRGVMGAGPNRMNIYTVRRATQGLADYLKDVGNASPVAIAYDSRRKSRLFAKETARVLAANGRSVWLYPRLMPTPALSFAVRQLACSAGICITASHNPAQYNGYKVYGPDGGQITNAAAAAIQRKMACTDPFDGIRLADFDEAVKAGDIRFIAEEVVDAFLRAVASQGVHRAEIPCRLKVVYTPLHGTGTECVTRALANAGIGDVYVVPEQAAPDGGFPTCPSPNPENPAALELGVSDMRKQDAELLLATDPDCDRVGVAVRHRGAIRHLNGNEVGLLLLDYLCAIRCRAGTLPDNSVAVTTIVSTLMAARVAAHYGVALYRVLTGFKYIGEQAGLLEKSGQGKFVFGFEESCGYLSGGYVRDKDAVGACMLVCEMARWHKGNGQTLVDVLEGLYRRHGFFANTLHSLEYTGVQGQSTMRAIMEQQRRQPPKTVAGIRIESHRDYLEVRADETPLLPPADVLEYTTAGGGRILLRPSGTEPKLKLYIETTGASHEAAASTNMAIGEGMCALLQWDAMPPVPAGTGGESIKGEPCRSSSYPPQPKTTSGAEHAL